MGQALLYECALQPWLVVVVVVMLVAAVAPPPAALQRTLRAADAPGMLTRRCCAACPAAACAAAYCAAALRLSVPGAVEVAGAAVASTRNCSARLRAGGLGWGCQLFS